MESRLPRGFCVCALAVGIAASAMAPHVDAQATTDEPVVIDPVTVTATRRAERAFDVPASVDTIDAQTLHDGQPRSTCRRRSGAFPACLRGESAELRAGPAGQLARLRRARAFGVRGVRLYQDGIPVTMPDGQGQTGSFSLLSAQRIEILRGPFSALYGNASGGVISVFTEDPPEQPVATFAVGGGSYGTFTIGAMGAATEHGVGAVVAGNYFETDGFRDHSSARRDLTNAKLTFDVAPSTHVTLIGNTQYQPETQDPLGLTRAQWSANPRGADPAATQFDTRKTINQMQGGAAVDHRFNDAWQLHVDALRRSAADPPVPGACGHGGDVVRRQSPISTRDYGGVGARLTWRGTTFDRPLVGDRAAPTPIGSTSCAKGSSTTTATLGDLRRNEDDTVKSTDVYAQAELAAVRRLVGDSRDPHQQRPLRFDRSLHHRRQPRRQRRPALQRHEPGCRRRVPRERPPERLRELRRGVRDADVRRARLPQRRLRAQLRAAAGDEPRR